MHKLRLDSIVNVVDSFHMLRDSPLYHEICLKVFIVYILENSHFICYVIERLYNIKDLYQQINNNIFDLDCHFDQTVKTKEDITVIIFIFCLLFYFVRTVSCK